MSTQTFPLHIDGHVKGLSSSHVEYSEHSHSSQLNNIRTEALVVEAPGAEFKRQTIYLDEIRGDELLIEMKYSGICHTVSSPISLRLQLTECSPGHCFTARLTSTLWVPSGLWAWRRRVHCFNWYQRQGHNPKCRRCCSTLVQHMRFL